MTQVKSTGGRQCRTVGSRQTMSLTDLGTFNASNTLARRDIERVSVVVPLNSKLVCGSARHPGVSHSILPKDALYTRRLTHTMSLQRSRARHSAVSQRKPDSRSISALSKRVNLNRYGTGLIGKISRSATAVGE